MAFCSDFVKSTRRRRSRSTKQSIELNSDHDALDELLNLQHYRLAYWRTADQELGYRRFFDVNTLVGLRVERPHVFEPLTAAFLTGFMKESSTEFASIIPMVCAIRSSTSLACGNDAPEAWIMGEKILEPGEFLRANWPIEGTSGYDFLNLCNSWLMHPDGLNELTQIYQDFTQEPTDFAAIAHDKKLNVEQEALGSDVNRLAEPLCRDLRKQPRPPRLHAGRNQASHPRDSRRLPRI